MGDYDHILKKKQNMIKEPIKIIIQLDFKLDAHLTIQNYIKFGTKMAKKSYR